MRFWLSGPRLLGGLVRPGVSFDLNGRPNRAARIGQAVGEYVYVIAGEHGHVKIGRSANPEARLMTLQTGSPFVLSIAFRAWAGNSAGFIEQEAHRLLGAYRLSGEWFDVSKELAVASVCGAAAKLNCELSDEPSVIVSAREPISHIHPIWWFIALLFASGWLMNHWSEIFPR